MKEQDFLILSVIYKTKNLTKAAEELFLTQPTLTYRVKKIEKELDVKLFRKDNQLIFTEEGEILVKFARRKLEEFEDIRMTLKNVKNDKEGVINIGVSTNFALYKLPSILEKFMQKFPNINVTIYSGWSHEIIDGLNNHDFQVGFITGEYEWFGEKELISADPLTVIYNDSFNLEDLPNLPRINYRPKTISAKNINPLKPIENEINSWWKSKFVDTSNIVMNIDTVETCKELVKRGLGFSIIPAAALNNADDFFTHSLTKRQGKIITRNTYLLYYNNFNESKTANKFVEFIKTNI